MEFTIDQLDAIRRNAGWEPEIMDRISGYEDGTWAAIVDGERLFPVPMRDRLTKILGNSRNNEPPLVYNYLQLLGFNVTHAQAEAISKQCGGYPHEITIAMVHNMLP